MRRPAHIRHGLEDRPPWPVVATTAAQQATVVLVFLYIPLIVGRAAQASLAQTVSLIGITFLACGIGTMVQAVSRHGLGCGFLAPLSPATPYLAPSVLAAHLGGLPLVAGMTLAAGLATVAFARLLHRIRALMPPEIAGVVVLIVGLAVAITGLRTLLRGDAGAPPQPADLLIALASLAVSVGLSVWGRGPLRWACVLIAMLLGSALAAALGRLRPDPSLDIAAMPLVDLPDIGSLGLDFDLALLPAFLVAALASSMKTVGIVTSLQRVNDADWTRPEPRGIAGGVTGDGLATALSGLLGAPGVNMSATNAALQSATGVTSRVIAFATGGLCILLACFPRLAALLSQVPDPVIAATLLQAGALMMAGGMQLATSRVLDARKSAAVGLSIVAAISVETVPQIADWVGEGLRPLMTAGAIGTLVAIALNAALRIGIRRRMSIVHSPSALTRQVVADLMERAGSAWALRADLVARVAAALNWSLDAIQVTGLVRGPVTLRLTYDESRLDVRLAYQGTRVELPPSPPEPEALQEGPAPARLAGHMILRLADHVTVRERNGTVELRMVLDD